ncbi:hypothetical protein B0O80DRAFT_459571 [Mortierella sp. GBAus27b]|nr:hypothetical protein B0O80DRAFT_459571 [Mortierella sp. GBAus27b]
MDGMCFKGPILDLLNNGHRYNPILDLMCNGRLQEMNLRNFDHFFQRIDISSMAKAPRLQILNLFALGFKTSYKTSHKISSKPSLYDRHYKAVLKKLLQRCPSLMELSIGVLDVNEAYEDLTEDISILPGRLAIRGSGIRVVMEVSHSKVLSVKAEIESPDCYSSAVPLLRKGCLTDLKMYHDPEDSSMEQLVDVLLWNPNTRNVTVSGCSLDQSTVETIALVRERVLSTKGSCALRQVKINFLKDALSLDVTLEFQDGSTSPDVSASYHMQDDASYHMQDDVFQLHRNVFLLFGWCFTFLATIGTFRDSLASLLDMITEKRGSKINSLLLNTTNLTTAGVECMERVIDRSRDLDRIILRSYKMDKELQQETFERLINRYDKRLKGLELHGDSIELWLPRVMSICPTRNELPELEYIHLSSNLEGELSLDCAQWIARMASGSCQLPSTFLSLSPIQLNIASRSSGRNKCPLRRLVLDVTLHSDGWEVVFKALDFSILRILEIRSKFSLDDYTLLIDCIPLNSNPVEKLGIYLWNPCFESEDDTGWDTQYARLRAKLPNANLEPSF